MIQFAKSELSGGKYLIYEVKHTAEDIQKAYAEIFPSIQSYGYQIDNKPILERYTGDMINNPYCEKMIPAKPFSSLFVIFHNCSLTCLNTGTDLLFA